MPSPLHEIDRKCKLCGKRMLAAFLESENTPHGQMWRKSAPVFLCGTCDFTPHQGSARLHSELRDKRSTI